MRHQVLAPLTRRTDRSGMFMRIGLAQNEAYRQDGLNKLLAIFPESDFATGPLISKIPRTRLGELLSTCACGRTI